MDAYRQNPVAVDARPAPPPPPPPNEISEEELFGKSAEEAQRSMEQASGIERVDELEARVNRIQTLSSGKIVVELDNGQVWRQTDTAKPRVDEGDTVIVRRGSLGSYRMQKLGSKRSMRVTRSN